MSLLNKSTSELLTLMLGAFGDFPIPGTSVVRIPSFGFEAFTTSVIESVKDINGQERIEDIGWKAQEIPAGKTVFFGFEASSIKLASGTGKGYRTQSPFESK